ncbi:protein kinase domain-containing protein [Sansalvadorimonas verongulae]|uniref:protein kinase domain-containing protein n=1 Tax=Sansalvadorimonas verongulae TaxID=2172824 RepID=UPI0018AD1581|nr:protein kinase [Sansalvadorimonas verongulae]
MRRFDLRQTAHQVVSVNVNTPTHPLTARQVANIIALNIEDYWASPSTDSDICGTFGAVRVACTPQYQDADKFIVKTNLRVSDARNFLEEAQLMSRLQHPNIVACVGYSYMSDDNLTLILMPKLEQSLTSWLNNIESSVHKPTTACRFLIFEGSARGLQYIHSKKFVHRDLSSNNLMLRGDGHAQIIDFGRTLPVNATNPNILCEHGDRVWKYFGNTLNITLSKADTRLPPEFFYGKKVEYSGDIFSWGLILLQILQSSLIPYAWTNAPQCQFNLDCPAGCNHFSRKHTSLNDLRSCISHPHMRILDNSLPAHDRVVYKSLLKLACDSLNLAPEQRPESMGIILENLKAIKTKGLTQKERIMAMKRKLAQPLPLKPNVLHEKNQKPCEA